MSAPIIVNPARQVEATARQDRHLGRRGRWLSIRNVLPLCAAGLIVTGCASTRSHGLSYQAIASNLPAPTEILIDVAQGGPGNTGRGLELADQQRQQIAAGIKAELTRRLKWAPGRIAILSPSDDAAARRDSLVLRCTITQIKPGSQALRLAVGFGAGRATLGINTQLIDFRGRSPVYLTTFSTRSTTGAMPSPALGLVGAASGGNVIGIAGGTAGLLLGARGTINHEIAQSSVQIAGRIQAYLNKQG